MDAIIRLSTEQMPQEFSRLARLFTAVAGFAVLAACGGGGGNNGAIGTPPPGGGSGATVTVSGKITFDRLQFQPTLGTGLNSATPLVSPAREVVVEAVSNNAVIATDTTDSNGDYSFSVAGNTNVIIRARAQMLKADSAPTWNFTVRNNFNSDAVYALEGDSFNTGTTNWTRDLHAPSGWVGNSYDDTRRFAGPFAILDTVYRTKQLILGALPTAIFPELNLYWSVENRTTISRFCPDDGDIGTSFYFRDPSGTSVDDCNTVLPDGIYILGEYENDGDTDEFDAHVIAHEFGHYFEDRFSRSDSIGGEHGIGNHLDLRVAFGEGWGNAFGAMSLGDPQYRDSSEGISADGGFNLETGFPTDEGWFSEASVGEFLWDVFDDNATAPESGDDVALGFNPIFAVMTDEQIDTTALTSIFPFATALRGNNGGESADIASLLQREEISGSGEFGTGETNDGGDPSFTDVYVDIAVGAPVTNICSTSDASGNTDGNRLGNRQFLRFVKNASGLVTIQADGFASATVPGSAAAQDPDILVHQRGAQLSFGMNTNGEPIGESSDPGQEQISQVQLAAGTYVLEVYAYEVIDPNQAVTTPRCMTVSISGTP